MLVVFLFGLLGLLYIPVSGVQWAFSAVRGVRTPELGAAGAFVSCASSMAMLVVLFGWVSKVVVDLGCRDSRRCVTAVYKYFGESLFATQPNANR